MVSKKSFTLLVETGTIPFFAVVPIISDGDCSIFIYKDFGFEVKLRSFNVSNFFFVT